MGMERAEKVCRRTKNENNKHGKPGEAKFKRGGIEGFFGLGPWVWVFGGFLGFSLYIAH